MLKRPTTIRTLLAGFNTGSTQQQGFFSALYGSMSPDAVFNAHEMLSWYSILANNQYVTALDNGAPLPDDNTSLARWVITGVFDGQVSPLTMVLARPYRATYNVSADGANWQFNAGLYTGLLTGNSYTLLRYQNG